MKKRKPFSHKRRDAFSEALYFLIVDMVPSLVKSQPALVLGHNGSGPVGVGRLLVKLMEAIGCRSDRTDS